LSKGDRPQRGGLSSYLSGFQVIRFSLIASNFIT
jgi:hypothetical protein